MLVARHEHGVLRSRERQQIVVAGVARPDRRRPFRVWRDRRGASEPVEDGTGLLGRNAAAELRVGEGTPELRNEERRTISSN
jgi:hypothetical protein